MSTIERIIMYAGIFAIFYLVKHLGSRMGRRHARESIARAEARIAQLRRP